MVRFVVWFCAFGGCVIALLDFGFFVFLTCLHAHETAPDEDAAAVQESRDDVASQQGNVGPRFADVCCEVLVQSRCQGSFGILLVGRLAEQCCAFCVDLIGSETIL